MAIVARSAARDRWEKGASISVSETKVCNIPSPWFVWHADVIGEGCRVLDIACGQGRHAIAAARLGAHVVALDADGDNLSAAEEAAKLAGVRVEWVRTDLERDPLPPGVFDVVTIFNYLDRARMPTFLQAVAPGGWVLLETFLEQQREFGWGPSSPDHLLRPAEIISLVQPFEIMLARDVIETIDGQQMALASVLAQRPVE